MSFPDPQSVTFPAPISATVSLPQVSQGIGTGAYKSADGLVQLSASHQYGKRTRRLLRLDYQKIAADLFVPDTNVLRSISAYVVVDEPVAGFSQGEKLAVVKGLTAAMAASSDALTIKFLGGES